MLFPGTFLQLKVDDAFSLCFKLSTTYDGVSKTNNIIDIVFTIMGYNSGTELKQLVEI